MHTPSPAAVMPPPPEPVIPMPDTGDVLKRKRKQRAAAVDITRNQTIFEDAARGQTLG